MKRVIAGILVSLLSFSSFAGFDAKVGENVRVVGVDQPCKTNLDPMFVMQLALGGVPVSEFKQAAVDNDGDQWGACWVEAGKTKVFVADEFGNFGFIELGEKI